MALEDQVFHQDSFGHLCNEFYALQNGAGGGGIGRYGFGFLQEEKGFLEMLDSCMENNLTEISYPNGQQNNIPDQKWDPVLSPEGCTTASEMVMMDGDQQMTAALVTLDVLAPSSATTSGGDGGRRKKRRTRTCKNKEELENQRMTHIAVERNRRRQMNDYLSVIRSMMPTSYVQRGDQASIIGGAINFVKELEQHLQTLEAQKRSNNTNTSPSEQTPQLFSDFFAFPQYTTSASLSHYQCENDSSSSSSTVTAAVTALNTEMIGADQKRPVAVADIEVSMADSHANLKIRSKRRPRQLLKLVAGLQCLWFTILHLYVTTVDQMVLYSISLKIEEGCQLTTIDEIADAVNQLLGRIEEEAAFS